MIAAWGESESDAETKNPKEEETTNLCLMASHESKDEKSKGKQVNTSNSFSAHPSKLNKNKLIELLMEIQGKLEKCNDKCLQSERELKISKDHISYINTFRSEVQNRLFSLLDQNTILKENMERIKKENFILNVELTQYKLLGLNKEVNDASIKNLCTDFQNLNSSFEVNRSNNDKVELESNSREKGKIKNVPKWIEEPKSKNSKRLDYFKNNKKKKVYVDLPSDRIYSYCGKTGHLKDKCTKREQHTVSNKNYVDNIWIKKVDSCKIDAEPKKA